MTLGIIAVLFIMIGFYLLFKVMKIEEQLKGVKYKLDLISKEINVPENPINDELRTLIDSGEDVKAVKKAREVLGLSLVEGKQYIDTLKLENK